MKSPVLALALALSLLVVGCGDPTAAVKDKARAEVDRSDLEAVAEASMRALITKDYAALDRLLVPEQHDALDALRSVAETTGEESTSARVVSISASVSNADGETASVEYTGEYCVAEADTEVPITTEVDATDEMVTSTPTNKVIRGQESCFGFDEVFGTDSFVGSATFRRIDGEWYAAFLS